MASPSTTKTATPTLPPPTGLIPTQPGIIRVDLTPQGNTSPPRAEPSPHTPPCSHPGTQQGLLNEPKTTFNRWLKETESVVQGERGSRQVSTQKVESGKRRVGGEGVQGRSTPRWGGGEGLWRPKGRRKRADAQTEV